MDSRKHLGRSLSLAVILFCTCTGFDNALERAKIDGHDTHDIEIYIEKRLTYLHARIDLRPTIEGLKTLEKCIYRLSKSSTDSFNLILSKNLEKKLERLVAKVERVDGKKSRSKRSIEFVGNLISDLFGNPGPSEWKLNKANILELKNAMTRLNDNSLIEHKDIDINRHSIEKQNEDLRRLSAGIVRNQNELAIVQTELMGLKHFFEISTFVDSLECQIDFLIEVKIDGMKGFCSDRAIEKEFLIENLHLLESNKIGMGPVYGSWEWREYYKYEMCTIALEGDFVWVTTRIPLVKKAEKLTRIIPTQTLKEAQKKLENYGLDVMIFREKTNDKFHVMTRGAFDLCNKLGNVRTCGVRDIRFVSGSNLIVPTEFSLNRILIVGKNKTITKITSKCPEGVTEVSLKLDVVILVPNNCSFRHGSFSIETREVDTAITNEIGISSFGNLDISNVKDDFSKDSDLNIERIANETSKNVFENNKKEIDYRLNQIDTNHKSLDGSFAMEKWLLWGGVGSVLIIVLSFKVIGCIRKKRNNNTILVVDRERNDNVCLQQQQQQQQQQQRKQKQERTNEMTCETSDKDKTTDKVEMKKVMKPVHVYEEIDKATLFSCPVRE